MSLVNPKNTLLTPEDQADESDAIIRPGLHASEKPWLIPWCASCAMMVEKWTFDFITNVFRMGLHVQCHGKTESVWITPEDLLARKRGGQPIVVFRRRQGFDKVR